MPQEIVYISSDSDNLNSSEIQLPISFYRSINLELIYRFQPMTILPETTKLKNIIQIGIHKCCENSVQMKFLQSAIDNFRSLNPDISNQLQITVYTNDYVKYLKRNYANTYKCDITEYSFNDFMKHITEINDAVLILSHAHQGMTIRKGTDSDTPYVCDPSYSISSIIQTFDLYKHKLTFPVIDNLNCPVFLQDKSNNKCIKQM